jgi:adenine-specific DNA-methyltransferase
VGGVPVFPATEKQKAPIIQLVQTILSDPDSPSVPKLEAEINRIVYSPYNLSPDEIKCPAL